MAKITTAQTNFTAGELSPRLAGRTDISRYANGAEILENAWPVVHGGCVRRWGTRMQKAAKHADKRSRLVPFVFDRNNAYQLEVGDGYIRVFKPAGRVETSPGVAYEIASPYTAADLAALDFTQGPDALIFWHGSYWPRRLRRFGDARWVLDLLPLNPAPFDEIGQRPAASLTLSAATVGVGRTLTASAASFLVSDIGREIAAGSGSLTITAVGSSTTATATITTEFDATVYAANAWTITGSPQATCTPSAATPVGGAVTLTLSAAGWRAGDVGSFVEINSGLVRITGYTSDTQVSGVIERALNTAVAAVANSWTLQAVAWNAVDGYPSTGTLYQQRLWAAGTRSNPQTVWGSAIGQYLGFMMGGVLDTDAVQYSLAGDDVNPIQYLVAMDALVALTYSGVSTFEGGIEKPITPTNVRAKQRTNRGCAQVRPVTVGEEQVYVQRGGKRVRAIGYSQDSGQWAAPDISVLAEHIAAEGVSEMSWHDDPDMLIFAVRPDGAMGSETFDRDQDVAGWARQFTGATYGEDGEITSMDAIESVATIPAGDADQTWLIVRRTVNGSTVRYVETFDPDLHTDCASVQTAPGGATVWTGLGHLEGRTVQIKGDGVVWPSQVVTGGQVTTPRAVENIEVGLQYRSRARLLTPEAVGQLGSAQGAAMDVGEVYVDFLESFGCKVNGQNVEFRRFGAELLDQPLPIVTGLHKVENLGWEDGRSVVEITQDEPMPWHIRRVIRKWSFNP